MALQSGRLQIADVWLRQLTERGAEPDAATWNHMVRAAVREKAVDVLRGLLKWKMPWEEKHKVRICLTESSNSHCREERFAGDRQNVTAVRSIVRQCGQQGPDDAASAGRNPRTRRRR